MKKLTLQGQHSLAWHFGLFGPILAKKCFDLFGGNFFAAMASSWHLQGCVSTTRGTFEPKTYTWIKKNRWKSYDASRGAKPRWSQNEQLHLIKSTPVESHTKEIRCWWEIKDYGERYRSGAFKLRCTLANWSQIFITALLFPKHFVHNLLN